MLKRNLILIPVLCAATLLALNSCDLEQPYKTILLSDTAENYAVQIKSFEDSYVVVVLSANVPDIATFNIKDVWKSPYTITKVKQGIVNAKLSFGELSLNVDYWDGSGSYWVVLFQLNARGTTVGKALVSKDPHDFFEETTRLSNRDFMASLDVNLDFSEFLPF